MSILRLEEWLQTPQGRYLLDWEQDGLDRLVADIFGYHAVQLGLSGFDLLRANRMPRRIDCGPQGRDLRCSEYELPFATGSLDLVLLPHVLEFSAHPHRVLREVERVLVPEGKVVILGFNPFSFWGLHLQWQRWRQRFGLASGGAGRRVVSTAQRPYRCASRASPAYAAQGFKAAASSNTGNTLMDTPGRDIGRDRGRSLRPGATPAQAGFPRSVRLRPHRATGQRRTAGFEARPVLSQPITRTRWRRCSARVRSAGRYTSCPRCPDPARRGRRRSASRYRRMGRRRA